MGNTQKSRQILMLVLLFAMIFLRTAAVRDYGYLESEKGAKQQFAVEQNSSFLNEALLNINNATENLLNRILLHNEKLSYACKKTFGMNFADLQQASALRKRAYLETFLFSGIMLESCLKKQIHFIQALDGKK